MLVFCVGTFCVGAYLLGRALAAAIISRAERAAFYRRTGLYLYH